MAKNGRHYYLVTLREVTSEDYHRWTQGEALDDELGTYAAKFPHLAEEAFEVDQDLFIESDTSEVTLVGQNQEVVGRFSIFGQTMW